MKLTKRLSIALSAYLMFFGPPQHADADNLTPPTLVIMDTALDTTIPEVKASLVHEVCLLEWSACPNGREFMEGPGSSTLPKEFLQAHGFNHGTQMVSAAIRTYPKVKILFMRIIANSSSGVRLITTERTVYQALEWVIANKTTYNIVAIGLSQSHHRLLKLKQYCPNSTRTNTAIKNLYSLEIPLFVASGNDNDKNRVSWPACVPEAMAISAISNGTISRYSNFDKELSDFAAIGELTTTNVGGKPINSSGTSIAAQVMAALWTQARAEITNSSFLETLQLFRDISRKISVDNGQLLWLESGPLNEAIIQIAIKKGELDPESLGRDLVCKEDMLLTGVYRFTKGDSIYCVI